MEWIRDRMPDDGQYCIGAILLNNGKIRVEQIVYNTSHIYDARISVGNYGWIGGSDYFSEKQLIAWMPLPDAPDLE